jgi:hypothetical protein
MAAYSVNHTKYIDTLCGQNSEVSEVGAGGTVVITELGKVQESKQAHEITILRVCECFPHSTSEIICRLFLAKKNYQQTTWARRQTLEVAVTPAMLNLGS